MSAAPWQVYYAAQRYLADGTHNLSDSTGWRVALCGPESNAGDLSLDPASFAAVAGELPAEFGYQAGGAEVTGQTWLTVDGATTFDSNDVTWQAQGGPIAAAFAVYYRNEVVNGVDRPLLCVCALDGAGGVVTASDGTPFSVRMHEQGLFALTSAPPV